MKKLLIGLKSRSKKLLITFKSRLKKFSVVMVSAVMCCSLLAFVGCDAQNKNESSIQSDKYDIGYKLDVYPSCKFNYKVDEDCVVTINNITVTLTQKNEIKEGETVLEPYYPYVFHVYANGSTDRKFAGKKIYLLVIIEEMYKQFYYYDTTIEQDGSITWEYDQTTWTSVTRVLFHSVSFSV